MFARLCAPRAGLAVTVLALTPAWQQRRRWPRISYAGKALIFLSAGMSGRYDIYARVLARISTASFPQSDDRNKNPAGRGSGTGRILSFMASRPRTAR